MMDWEIVRGDVQPILIDFTSAKYVYLRRNVQKITVSDEGFDYDVWQYEECKITKDEYARLRINQLEDENTNLQLALTELYESILEG